MRAMLLTVVLASTALAQGDSNRPWAQGVSKERQAQALVLFREGNARLRDALYKVARDRYLEALKSWDHPAIHYNLSLTLVNLDQPVEAHEHLLLALKYGAAPLDAEKLDQAKRYRGLLEKQLTKLVLRCAQEGASVRIDGNQVFTGPGAWEGMVRAGSHSVVATREGFVPTERALTLVGGEAKELELTLFRTEDLTEYRRLWPVAVPWVVVGAGALVVGGGVGLHLGARSAFAEWDTGVTTCANPETRGCVPNAQLVSTRSRGDTFQTLAITSYVVGGAALATGAVLVYLNRLTPFVRSPDAPAVTLVPVLGPGGAGASLHVSF